MRYSGVRSLLPDFVGWPRPRLGTTAHCLDSLCAVAGPVRLVRDWANNAAHVGGSGRSCELVMNGTTGRGTAEIPAGPDGLTPYHNPWSNGAYCTNGGSDNAVLNEDDLPTVAYPHRLTLPQVGEREEVERFLRRQWPEMGLGYA